MENALGYSLSNLSCINYLPFLSLSELLHEMGMMFSLL